jgi:hypothetical protein
MGRRRTSLDDYNILVERAAEKPEVMRELKYYHKIKADGGDPTIDWKRGGRPIVSDAYKILRKPTQ